MGQSVSTRLPEAIAVADFLAGKCPDMPDSENWWSGTDRVAGRKEPEKRPQDRRRRREAGDRNPDVRRQPCLQRRCSSFEPLPAPHKEVDQRYDEQLDRRSRGRGGSPEGRRGGSAGTGEFLEARATVHQEDGTTQNVQREVSALNFCRQPEAALVGEMETSTIDLEDAERIEVRIGGRPSPSSKPAGKSSRSENQSRVPIPDRAGRSAERPPANQHPNINKIPWGPEELRAHFQSGLAVPYAGYGEGDVSVGGMTEHFSTRSNERKKLSGLQRRVQPK